MTVVGKWIVDTNVLVHWLMVNQIIEFASRRYHLGQEFFDVYRSRYKHSFDFIDKMLALPEDNQKFVITELSLDELFSGVRDEIRSILLFIKGVPISRWASKRETKEVRFPEGLAREVYELTLRGFDNLFESKKIEIIPATSPSDAPDYFEVYSSLVFLNPELRTQDAILVATAIFEKGDYFVTTDNDLMRLGDKLKQKYNLHVMKPATALQIINKM